MDFMAKVLPHVDTVLHDIKLTDPERHKKWCGQTTRACRANLKRAYETFPDKKFIARTPLIPGVNDDEEHIRATLAFIKTIQERSDLRTGSLYAFRKACMGFWGRDLRNAGLQSPTPETLKRLQAIIDEAFGRQSNRNRRYHGRAQIVF